MLKLENYTPFEIKLTEEETYATLLIKYNGATYKVDLEGSELVIAKTDNSITVRAEVVNNGGVNDIYAKIEAPLPAYEDEPGELDRYDWDNASVIVNSISID